jgi:hypothetical protein
MVLAVIAHSADEETGTAKLTYDQLGVSTGLSRAKISAGLRVLLALGAVLRSEGGKSYYKLTRFGLKEGWCKFPAKPLYVASRIVAFQEFSLRRSSELNALKLCYLFAARRGEDTNMANISYDKISDYAGIDKARIKTAISVLAAQGLVHVEHAPSLKSLYGVSNGYRLAHIRPRSHMGTLGRGMDAADFENS